jgi:TRAP transporter TAXI family solute receptor
MLVTRRSRQLLGALIAMCGVLMIPASALTAPPESQRISFQIATGPVSGSYLRVGDTIGAIISNPPGLARCENDGLCGPEGLIATSRSSSGSIANALSIARGRVQSAIVQGDIAAAAYDGAGPFRTTGALGDLRAMARLHDETIHFVVASRSRIKRISDLAGRRVAVDSTNAATEFTARSILALGRASATKLLAQTPDQAAENLRNGKLDAFFVIGSAPVRVVDGLIRRRQARLVGIEPSIIASLTRAKPMLSKYVLPSDTYRATNATTTLNVASLWLVDKSMSDKVVYAILRSLWNPANRVELARLGQVAQSIDAKKAAENLPLPLHPGAVRFYSEAGR